MNCFRFCSRQNEGSRMTGTGRGPESDSSHAEKIQSSMEQLLACAGDYSQLHAGLAAKRLAWWKANRERLELSGALPRQAYTLFLLLYLGLDPSEVPVVYEDERKITWRSFNFCSLLEACKRLGLDTRQVCRAGTERSVQDLIISPHSVYQYSCSVFGMRVEMIAIPLRAPSRRALPRSSRLPPQPTPSPRRR